MLYSERQGITHPRVLTDISERFWMGVRALIDREIAECSFAQSYPDCCEDPGTQIIGVNRRLMSDDIAAHISDLAWPIEYEDIPNTMSCFDLLEFLYQRLSKVGSRSHHSYYRHEHLKFEAYARDDKRGEFEYEINQLLQRNGLAFEMARGEIKSLLPQPLVGMVQDIDSIRSGDSTLDKLLADACGLIQDRHPDQQQIALEKLWDVWERLKTVIDPKKTAFLNRLDIETDFIELIGAEARLLTEFGNNHQIRHAEVGKIPLANTETKQYFFFRLLILIHYILKIKR